MTHQEVKVPPKLAVRLEELAEKIVDTFRISTEFQSGPQMVVQMIMLTLIRLGRVSNPDIVFKLRSALDIADQQHREMGMD